MSASDALKKARERAKEMGLPYEGALTPKEAQEVLQANPEAKLVDVRTRAELDWVGRVPGAVEVELQTWPGGRPNPEFMKELQGKVDKSAPVLFLCRSGGRSHNAAMMAT
jgi:rhodanese-related sulfurtransferase